MPEKFSPQTLEQFVDVLVDRKGLTNLAPEVLTQLKKDLLERVEDRVNAAILKFMPPENLEEFDRLLDSADTSKIQAYCAAHIPNLDEKMAAELMQFQGTYLNA